VRYAFQLKITNDEIRRRAAIGSIDLLASNLMLVMIRTHLHFRGGQLDELSGDLTLAEQISIPWKKNGQDSVNLRL